MSPKEVALNVSRLLALNDVLYTMPQLWLNLNIQWVGRAVEKYQDVTLEDLLETAIPNY
jgi:hypothetical protein